MRVEKRIPFGFCGDWGKVYKKYTAKGELKSLANEEDIIKRENNYYVDIGCDVQFKRESGIDNSTEENSGLIRSNMSYTTVKTTDSIYNSDKKQYECIVAVGDIVKVFNQLWIVTSLSTTIINNPAEQKFYILDLESLL